MDHNRKAALLAGVAFSVGIEHEVLELNREKQSTLSRARFEDGIVFGRHDHGSESWPYAHHTIEGVVIMLTTSSG